MPTEESSCCLDPDFFAVGDFGSAAAVVVESIETSPSAAAVMGDVGTAALEAVDFRGGMLVAVGEGGMALRNLCWCTYAAMAGVW